MSLVPVLEIGGTHADAVLIDTGSWSAAPAPGRRVSIDAHGRADELLDAFASCAEAVWTGESPVLAVAIPGPFDYTAGIGQFRDVGKFDALNGVDLGAGLRARLSPAPQRIVFVNDATAFGLGVWRTGTADRLVAITLGTGVGSAFIAGGTAITDGPDVPPNGYAYLLRIDDQPLEDVVSRRAILRRYRAAGGDPAHDVREIAAAAMKGEPIAFAAFTESIAALGTALAPWLSRFRAHALVVGGAISSSWSLVEPALRSGLRAAAEPIDLALRRNDDVRLAAATGAAWHAVRDESLAREAGRPTAGRDGMR